MRFQNEQKLGGNNQATVNARRSSWSFDDE